MKLILAICLVPFVASTAETRESSLGWGNLTLEGKALTQAGKYPAAAQAFRQALAIAEGANADERTLLGIYDALASAYANAGQYAESEHEYRRALALTEKSQGRQSLDYALLVASMVMLPTQVGNGDTAGALLREAIIANRQSGRARELAIVRICLAQILLDARRYAEAESVLLDTQGDLPALKTTNPKLAAELLNELGLLRFDQGGVMKNQWSSIWNRFTCFRTHWEMNTPY